MPWDSGPDRRQPSHIVKTTPGPPMPPCIECGIEANPGYGFGGVTYCKAHVPIAGLSDGERALRGLPPKRQEVSDDDDPL